MVRILTAVLLASTGYCLIMPLTKQDGSVDMNSVLNHITLLEQRMENMDQTSEVADLKSQLMSTQTTVLQLKSRLVAAEGALQESTRGSAIFTRWGSTTCPAGNTIIYAGYVGGTHYQNRASNANRLCLPDHPIYANHTAGGHGATIYGTEYETDVYSSGSHWYDIDDEDVPCVVCVSETKKSTIMVPARNQCYPGWNLEYWGYLMGTADGDASAEYICVDRNPEFVSGGKENKNGQLLYYIESICAPLPCPPYENNWELTCVVCSQ